MSKNSSSGMAALLAATLIYSFYGIFSRLIGLNFGAFTQNWLRNFIGLLIIFPILIIGKKWKTVRKKDVKWILVWPLSGSLTLALLFIVYNKMPIATTFFLHSSTTIVTSYITGKILFGEKLSLVKIIAIFLALTGLFFIYARDIAVTNAVFAFIAVLSGLMAGMWNTLSKKSSGKYPNLQLVFIDALVCTVVGFVAAVLSKETFPVLAFTPSWFYLFVNTFTSLSAVVLIIYGFKNLEAQIGSIVMSLQTVFTTILAFLIFGEVLSPASFFGGFLILLAAFLPNLSPKNVQSKMKRN